MDAIRPVARDIQSDFAREPGVSYFRDCPENPASKTSRAIWNTPTRQGRRKRSTPSNFGTTSPPDFLTRQSATQRFFRKSSMPRVASDLQAQSYRSRHFALSNRPKRVRITKLFECAAVPKLTETDVI